MSKLHIFHHNDADGRLSAAIVIHALRTRVGTGDLDKFDYAAYEMGYETKPDFSQIATGDTVYVVDFSFKDDVFDQLIATGAGIIWIDHHKSVVESRHSDLPGLRQFVNKGPAACELTWKYLFDENPPSIVWSIGDYDSWAHKFKSSVAVNEACKADERLMDPVKWISLLNDDDCVGHLAESGQAMIRYRDGYCANLRKAYGHQVCLWDSRWYVGGLTKETGAPAAARVTPDAQPGALLNGIDPAKYTWAYDCCKCSYALNVQNFGSLAFGDELMSKYHFVIAYIHNGKEFVVSLYSTDSTIDCSVIAKAFGGGGHKGAAGFRCTELPWQVSRYTTRVVDIEHEKAVADLKAQEASNGQ